MSKKKTPKGALHEKKISVSNIKHSGDKKKISLTKFNINENIYSDINSEFSNNKLDGTELSSGGASFLSLAVTTPKAKKVIIDLVSGFLIGTIDFGMNENIIHLPLPLNISLEKRWIDSKVVKTQVEVPIKKSFALDINLSAVKEKSVTAKTQFIRKFFSLSLIKAISLTREKRIITNSDLKKQKICSNQAVVIKRIFMDTPKEMIVTALAEFGKIKAWLFTLPVETTAHNLSTFLKGASGKTCIINCLLNSGNRIYCAVVGFKSENAIESAYCTKLIFGGVKLSWARLNLVCCERCKFLGHSALKCGAPLAFTPKSSKIVRKVTSVEHCLWLARLYAKKTIMSLNSSSDSSPSYMAFLVSFGNSLFSGARISSVISAPSGDSALHDHLFFLKCSLELLADQVSDILRKLNNIELVSLASLLLVPPPIASISLVVDIDLDITLDDALIHFILLSMVVTNTVADISLNSSKVLTTKVGGLKSKMMALEVSVNNLVWKFATCNIRDINVPAKQEDIVCWHKKLGNMVSIVTETKLRSNIRSWIINKFDGIRIFTSGLGVSFFGTEVAIIMNSSLVWHVSKMNKIPGRLIFVHFLFKDKLLVTILGLYTGASVNTYFSQTSFINSLISKAANSSSFTVINGVIGEVVEPPIIEFIFKLSPII
ncbi:hypothetical protein G9A89_008411 [Geosiphon pyriformis]|nr:hypothetical protein G9A89_008411 [Geosiphon pyriformis]